MQRQRDFRAYEDLEARYERRPSAWVEPIGDWGEGAVHLVEIPTSNEINDNIVAYWRPRNPTRAKGEYAYTYRIHWGGQIPKPLPLARVIGTRIGAGQEEARLIVLEFAGENLKAVAPADIKAVGCRRQGQGAQRRVAAEPGDRRHARELPARRRRREGDRAARPAAARRGPPVGSLAVSMDALTRQRARAPYLPRRGAAGDAGAVAARRRLARRGRLRPRRARSARAAPSCSARRSRSRCSPPTRCIWCSRSAG